MEEEIEGYVEHIIFRNDENGYTVFELVSEDVEETCVGNFPFINEGEYIVLRGNRVNHALYQEQIKVTSYEIKEPEDIVAMQRYLASGAIKGVGGGLAKRIIDKFGEATFTVIEKEPERLSEVKGISDNKAREMGQQIAEKKELRKAMLYLQKYGISNQLAVKIYNQYQDEMYNILEHNPYRLAEDVAGIGFKIADGIALQSGLALDSMERVRAGIFHVLSLAGLAGHTYFPEQSLYRKVTEILGTNTNQLVQVLDSMAAEKAIVIKEQDEKRCIYSASNYYEELNCARMVLDLTGNLPIVEKKVSDILERVKNAGDISLDDKQILAVREALTSGLLIITGGPGTGKTTTINTIIKVLQEEGMEILLAAPTGRAAKRLSETTGQEAQTIHRLLQYNGSPEEQVDSEHLFERDEWNPLETDVVIIDEMSMVDIHLFYHLLKAISVGTRLILVGDVNQLPSVGPGNVLRDLIHSQCCKVVRLTKIFRQAAQSDIIMNAHKINKGEDIRLDNKSRDFFCLEKADSHSVLEVVLWLVRDKMPKYVDCSPFDVQVLTPMRKGELGVENCNQVLQKYLNPPDQMKPEMEAHKTIFRLGDKVMQIKNNYQIEWRREGYNRVRIEEGTGVFNGDCGRIKELDTVNRELTVEFDEGKCVEYSYGSLDELELAYAITIHKSQGSEYPAIVMPLLTGPSMLMNRNLLYTGVTRGKKCVTIVGRSATVRQMIANENEQKRYSTLAERIQEM